MAPHRLAALLSALFLAFAAPLNHASANAAPPTILVIGNSQAQGVAGALQRMFMRSKEYHVIDRSKIGTGLSSYSGFDWNKAIEQMAETEHADFAIAMFGVNDRPQIRVNGEIDPIRAANFSKNYAERVGKIVKSLRDAHTTVIWVGEPQTSDGDYASDMELLNQIVQPAVETQGARWISTWDVGADDKGGYTAYGKAADGQTKRLRTDDGVHFTAAGYDLIAARLLPLLKAEAADPAAAPQPAASQPAPTTAANAAQAGSAGGTPTKSAE